MFSTTAFHPSMARKLYFLKGHIFKAQTMEEEMMLGEVTQTQKKQTLCISWQMQSQGFNFYICLWWWWWWNTSGEKEILRGGIS